LLLSVRRHWPENVEYAKVRDVKYFNGPDLLHLFSMLVCTKRERMPVSVHWNGLYFELSVSGYWLPVQCSGNMLDLINVVTVH